MARRVRSTRLVWLAALCWLFVGCSSGGDASATTTSAEVTTQPAASASATSTETTTTTATTTSTSESSTSPEDAAAQAVLDKADAWRECVEAIASCDPEGRLADSTTGASLDSLVGTLESWRAKGWEVRPPANPNDRRDEILEVQVVEAASVEATVLHCQIDGAILVEVGAAPDGSDVVVDDRVVSSLAQSVVVLGEDGRWRVSDLLVLERFEGGDGCGSGEA